MATRRLTLQYGLVAVVLALGIIGASVYFNPGGSPVGAAGKTSFVVMLTDPPTVPRGTTELNVTYSGIQLHVVSGDGSVNWIAAQESGRVNLLSLVNVTQTIASVSLPTGSSVDALQLKLSSAEAKINGVVHPVTLLSEDLLISIRQTTLNGTTTGALIDLRPTLVQIDATNSTGGHTSYYVLSPSAAAVVRSNVTETQCMVGYRWRIGHEENDMLERAYLRALGNVTITGSSLSADGNVTTISVTLKNVGGSNATIFGLTLGGAFNVTSSFLPMAMMGGSGYWPSGMAHGRNYMYPWPTTMGRPEVIPFKIIGSELAPIFGDRFPGWTAPAARLVLEPGESVTLTYTGVIGLHVDGRSRSTNVAVTPISGRDYTLTINGWGFKAVTLKADN